jgi:hypothetical protein
MLWRKKNCCYSKMTIVEVTVLVAVERVVDMALYHRAMPFLTGWTWWLRLDG